MRVSNYFVILSTLLPLLACSSSTAPSSTSVSDQQMHDAASAVAKNVIVETYKDLDTKASILLSAVTSLKGEQTDVKLSATRDAWKAARRPWEQSEAFLFGPVETSGIDPKIDSWPLNKTDLDAVLASNAALTKEYIDQLESTQKGFHTMEYLLFGASNNKMLPDITSRQLEYLVACAQSFQADVHSIVSSWDSTDGNFVLNFTENGTTNSIYNAPRNAVEELVNGMISICNEVANGKINDPFTEQNRLLEESAFSDNSDSDFSDNIRSVKNVYLGTTTGLKGDGISALVSSVDVEFDNEVKAAIDNAIAQILAMTPTFGQAITTNKAQVTTAQQAVQRVMVLLQGEAGNASAKSVKKILGLN